MRSKNIMGLIFANTNDEKLTELTSFRTMGSVPFGCRYRMIDFALSSMVNAGIFTVGVVTKKNYQSLMDHLENGKSWDLARKRGGLRILPPYSYSSNGIYKDKIDAMYGNISYLEHSTKDYVLIADSDVVANINVDKMIEKHVKTNADITVAYKSGIAGSTFCDIDEDDRITRFTFETDQPQTSRNVYVHMMLMRRDLLISLIKNAYRHNYTNFELDVLQREVSNYKMCGFDIGGHATIVDSIQSYFNSNMMLLDSQIRNELFEPDRPIFTKLRDDMPTRYGYNAKITDSLIADGCVIDGEVKNSIIFRGVHIEKGCKIENCILMQSAHIGKNCTLSYVVTDKNVSVKEGRTLMGYKTFPLVVGKGLSV
jgi:glucose-1-phosphate adenylyltransferase